MQDDKDKKEYTAEEAASIVLDKAKTLISDLNKSAPENKTSAQMQGLKVPQPEAPKAQEKVIAKKPLQLKKFMEKCEMKKTEKGS